MCAEQRRRCQQEQQQARAAAQHACQVRATCWQARNAVGWWVFQEGAVEQKSSGRGSAKQSCSTTLHWVLACAARCRAGAASSKVRTDFNALGSLLPSSGWWDRPRVAGRDAVWSRRGNVQRGQRPARRSKKGGAAAPPPVPLECTAAMAWRPFSVVSIRVTLVPSKHQIAQVMSTHTPKGMHASLPAALATCFYAATGRERSSGSLPPLPPACCRVSSAC